MSGWLVLLSLLTAANPARVAMALQGTQGGGRMRLLVVGSGITGLVLLVVGAAGDWILDFLDITDETWRIAAGSLAVMASARHLVFAPATPVPHISQPRHALAPIAFPVLLVPELVVLVVLYGATESFGLLALGILVGLGLAVAWGRRTAGSVDVGAVGLWAAVLLVAGFALIVAGIRDV